MHSWNLTPGVLDGSAEGSERFGVEHLEAALSATGRRVVILDDNEVDDDLTRDMIEVLTSFCARLYGRRGARNRALRAAAAAEGQAD